ncbi:hypothetical protein FVE85_9266 [Porphyridium purpureum]|uniref:Uncharacterized protein n=1 Tax=Porphyridium purpureum TaxID=35688 RepID=A0A5J4YQM6_PORPP|nr:hypothetical protein FVE85_9266 [Porphyridium purpureum]|eukprot:POR4679..scf222_8
MCVSRVSYRCAHGQETARAMRCERRGRRAIMTPGLHIRVPHLIVLLLAALAWLAAAQDDDEFEDDAFVVLRRAGAKSASGGAAAAAAGAGGADQRHGQWTEAQHVELQQKRARVKEMRAKLDDAMQRRADQSSRLEQLRAQNESLSIRDTNLEISLAERAHDADELLRSLTLTNSSLHELARKIAWTQSAIDVVHTDCSEILARYSTADFDDWLENKGKYVLAKTQYGFLKKSQAIARPMARELALTSKIQRRIFEQVEERLSIFENPLLAAALWTMIVLVPIIFVTSLVLFFVRHVGTLTAVQVAFLGNGILLSHAMFCSVLGALVDKKPLEHLRQSSPTLMLGSLILWVIVSAFVVMALLVHIAGTGTGSNALPASPGAAISLDFKWLLFSMSGYVVIAWHFYRNAWRPALSDDLVDFGVAAALAYAFYFSCVAIVLSYRLRSHVRSLLQGLQRMLGLRREHKSTKRERDRSRASRSKQRAKTTRNV